MLEECKQAKSFDGTMISYRVEGPHESVAEAGGKNAPVIVLSNGLGGFGAAWHFQRRFFSRDYRVITWNFRGLLHGEPAVDPETLQMPFQAKDLAAVLDAEEVEHAVFVGWSMGTQVNLELYRLMPTRVRGLVFITGTAGRPFDTAFGGKPWSQGIPVLLFAMDQVRSVFSPALRAFARSPFSSPLLYPFARAVKRVGDPDAFVAMAKEWSELDQKVYTDTFRALAAHDAFDLLPSVKVPVCLIAGGADVVTPLSVFDEMKALLPDAELNIIEGGTHFTLVQKHVEVNGIISSFLDRRPLLR